MKSRLFCMLTVFLGLCIFSLSLPLEAKLLPIDIAPWTNTGYSGPENAFHIAGPNDLRPLLDVVGQQVWGEDKVPYIIIDPAENDGKGVCILGSTTKPEFPLKIEGIEVNSASQVIYFLHTCGWGHVDPPGVHAATYVVHYSDSSKEEIPIILHEQITDWWLQNNPNGPDDLTDAEWVWTGPTHRLRLGYRCIPGKTQNRLFGLRLLI